MIYTVIKPGLGELHLTNISADHWEALKRIVHESYLIHSSGDSIDQAALQVARVLEGVLNPGGYKVMGG